MSTSLSACETDVARVFAEVLQLERVGRHDNFFELGGDSLLATQIVSRLQDRHTVTLRRLFEHPTIADLAAVLDRDQPGREPPPIRRVQRREMLPLSFAQSRMWFLEQFSPGASGYEVAVSARLKGTLDVVALQVALDAVAARHEGLRTRFPTLDGTPRQMVLDCAPIALRTVDLRAEPQRERAASDLVAAAQDEPFDLERGPLFRALLLRLDDDEHFLVLTMHHIVSDRWSMEILGHDLAELYRCAMAQTPSSLTPLKFDYVDYAVWQREWLQEDVLEEQLAYWRGQLDGVQGAELHSDHPRPAVATHDGGEVEFRMPAAVAAQLRALSRSLDATLFVTLLAAFKALLARYCDGTDIVVGTPTSGRNRQELEGMLGFFVNTVVLRTNCAGDPTFAQLIERVRDTAWAAFAHQDVPFERLVEELGVVRDPSRHPLFQIMFSVHHPFDPGGLVGLETTWAPLPATNAPFDLTLLVEDAEDGSLCGRLVFNQALFERDTINRLAAHLANLVASALACPTTPLSALELLSPAERHQLMESWNATTTRWRPACVHHLIEARADGAPDAVAVVAPDTTLTYGELDTRANRLAHHLRAHGIQTGSPVALCLDRRADLVVAVLATLKAGGAFVPLDPTHPPARLAFMLADTGARVVLTHAGLVSALPPTDVPVIALDADPSIASRPGERPHSTVTPDDVAYVIYTSGSTGQPKGVMVEHRNVANLAMAFADARIVTGADRVLAISPLTFDMAVVEVILPLVLGATSVVAPSLPHLDVWATVRDAGVTIVQATPSAWHLVGEPTQPTALEKIISGGEALTPWLAAKLRRIAGQVWNGYGPTEATVCALACDVSRHRGVPPVGRPLANIRVYVVGRSGELVPIGVPGELWIGGAGVARGYVGREDLTAERFERDPFLPGGRVYRTGDLVRWRTDGNLEFLGRRDHQVKIRGQRVECGEIEAALTAHPKVAEAVVTVRRDRSDQPELVGYVVGPEMTTGDLLRHLRATLPPAMVPTTFVRLDALPLTLNGKVDRAALPAPRPIRPDLEAPYEPPRTPTERSLARLFADVLGVDRVGIHDDFFDLGGHSLLAARLVSRLATDGSLALRALFAAPTVAGLAATIDGRPPSGAPASGETEAASPLGHVQVVPGAGGSTGWLVELIGDVFSGAIDVVGVDYRFDSRTQARPPTFVEYLETAAASLADHRGAASGIFGYCAGAVAALRLGERFEAPVFALDAPFPRRATPADTESAIRRRVRNLEIAGNLPPVLQPATEEERLAWLGRNWSAPLPDESLRFFRDDIRKFLFLHEQLVEHVRWVPARKFPLLMAMSKEFIESSPDALDSWQEAVPWATFEILDGGHLLAVRSSRCRALLRRWAGLEE